MFSFVFVDYLKSLQHKQIKFYFQMSFSKISGWYLVKRKKQNAREKKSLFHFVCFQRKFTLFVLPSTCASAQIIKFSFIELTAGK